MGNANIGNDGNIGLGNVAKFVNIAFVTGAHFQYQYLVGGFQVIIDNLADSHRGIIAAGGSANIHSLFQQIPYHKLRTGFSIAPGNGDDLKFRHA